jgi:amphi-Trp domain-containing protein
MPEEVIFKSEERATREEVAAHLRVVADRLASGEPLTLSSGSDELELAVPATTTFEVKAERETSKSGGPAELSVEFELEWKEGDGDESGGLSIE